MTHPIAKTKEEVLRQRVVAPCLKFDYASGRSAANESKAGRIYPEKIYPWNDFRDKVEMFELADGDSAIRIPLTQIFYESLKRAKEANAGNEAEEQSALTYNLKMTLRTAGIVHKVESYPKQLGRMDFCVMKDETNISIICECKSTQNLLLPMTAHECAASYNFAYAYGLENDYPVLEWSNVAHPIGQLLFYMIMNKHACGALTSGTRTYFIIIQTPADAGSDVATKKLKAIDVRGNVSVQNTCNLKAPPSSSVSSGKGETIEHDLTFASQSEHNHSSTSDNALSGVAHGQNTSSRNKGHPSSRMGANIERNQNTTSRNRKNHASRNDNAVWDDGTKVYISDAWCVGEANYLRAWAYMHELGSSIGSLQGQPNWLTSTTAVGTPTRLIEMKKNNHLGDNNTGKSTSPKDSHGSSHDYSNTSAKSCNMKHFRPIVQYTLDYVSFHDIVIVDVLGEGRNGTCFKVKWNGLECAMKQFDIGRSGDAFFKKEIHAYMLLQKAWGVLVPRPMFLSDFYGGVMFLGLQLGRESTSSDDLPKFGEVLRRLAKEYGIRHNDAEHGRNMVIITDTNGDERVAAIDFEDWDEVPVQQ